MGSASDLDIMDGAVSVLKELGINSEVKVYSAHRTPKEAINYSFTAEERGLSVIIAGAGSAAHLPGVLAACTPLPDSDVHWCSAEHLQSTHGKPLAAQTSNTNPV